MAANQRPPCPFPVDVGDGIVPARTGKRSRAVVSRSGLPTPLLIDAAPLPRLGYGERRTFDLQRALAVAHAFQMLAVCQEDGRKVCQIAYLGEPEKQVEVFGPFELLAVAANGQHRLPAHAD